METTIRTGSTLLTIVTVEPDKRDEVLHLLTEFTETTISKLQGWISTNFLASLNSRKIFIYSQWESVENVHAMQNNAALLPYFQRCLALSTFESFPSEVVYARHA
jgi:quinol monooxygenase YgiN